MYLIYFDLEFNSIRLAQILCRHWSFKSSIPN